MAVAGSVAPPLEEWKNWVLHALVLLSFTLQATLLVAAAFRRRVDSGWLRAFVWSAYILADWTAIYALGHLSVANWAGEHHLMLLWAPFLLVHLGGQDNITAYALEDNRLWLRHLQALAVQATAAAYVLYLSFSSPGGGGGVAVSRFRKASIILYVVGVLKYGERVAALWVASRSRLGENYRSIKPKESHAVVDDTIDFAREELTIGLDGDAKKEKILVLLAHFLLHVPKELLMGPAPYEFKLDVYRLDLTAFVGGDGLYKVAERQLSLMHDVLYTKAPVIRTSLYGFCMRIFSCAGTAAAFALFHQGLMQALLRPQENHHYCGNRYCNRADVAITYVLIVGAVVLEAVALVATVSSTWTELGFPLFMIAKEVLMRAAPPLLLRVSLRRWQLHSNSYYWSGTMGQQNLLELCVGSRHSRWSKAAWFIGLEGWWNTLAYSGSTSVTECVKRLVMELAAELNGGVQSSGSSSATAVGSFFQFSLRLQQLRRALGLCAHDAHKLFLIGTCDMDETILVWHIATNVYRHDKQDKQELPLGKAVQALSNYMLFILAARPGMLPAPSGRTRYMDICYELTTDDSFQCASPQDLANKLLELGKEADNFSAPSTLASGCWLGAKLTDAPSKPDGDSMLKLIAKVWVEILCYAGHRCSGNSHAGRLSNGGELLTVAAIVMEYVKKGMYQAFIARPPHGQEVRHTSV
ncbi:unnamed protein product [Urochloa decumbens]|uniref:DUF4220 domain-containing protein n=1 Tax=Urochloa decumbens TaxID=240449 RepID=A0ABC9B425_9POAL